MMTLVWNNNFSNFDNFHISLTILNDNISEILRFILRKRENIRKIKNVVKMGERYYILVLDFLILKIIIF